MFYEIGGYNPLLRSSEDLDFHFMAVLNGYQFYHSEIVDVHIRWHQGNTTKNTIKNIYFNLIAFELEIDKLNKNDFKELYKYALLSRLGSIKYWSNRSKRLDITMFINILLIKHIGIYNFIKLYMHSFLILLLKKVRKSL
jgi:hypothetical protein